MPWFWQDGATKSRALVVVDSTSVAQQRDPQIADRSGLHSDHSLNDSAPQTITQTLLKPANLLATAVLTTLLLSLRYIYATRLRRIQNTSYLPANYLLSTPSRSLFGTITSVGDGDNFRVYHTPGGRILGWKWLRKVPEVRKELTGQTLHVRIAGIDAPEMAHFGRPAQKYGPPALEWLTKTLHGQRVRVYTLRRDQYERVVGTAFLRRGLWSTSSRILNLALPWSYDKTQGPVFSRDVGLEMIRAGWATVYEANFGAVFGREGMEVIYREAERKARAEGKGMWAGQGVGVLQPISTLKALWSKLPWGRKSDAIMETTLLESPRQYKTRMAKLDAEVEAKAKAKVKAKIAPRQ